MADDPVNGLRLLDKRDDSHLATTCRTKQRVNLIDFSDHLGPSFRGYKGIFIFNNKRTQRVSVCFSHLSSVGMGIKAVVTDRNLYSPVIPDELQLYHCICAFACFSNRTQI
jgi:hypothetical protein